MKPTGARPNLNENCVDNPDDDLSAFTEAFGEEASGAIADYVNKKTEMSNQRYGAMELMLENMIIQNATAGMRDEFPQLQDAADVNKMVEKATALIGTGSYGGDAVTAMNSAMMDAANQLWGSDNRTVKAAAQNQLRDQKRRGTSSTPRGSSDRNTELTADERDSAVLTALDNGASVEEAQRAWG
jgi:hypothetical protein